MNIKISPKSFAETVPNSNCYVNVVYKNLENPKEYNFNKYGEDIISQKAALVKKLPMPKSHSFSGFNMPKSTIIRQDSTSERIATSLLEAKYFEETVNLPSSPSSVSITAEEDDERDVFLNKHDEKNHCLRFKSRTPRKPFRRLPIWSGGWCLSYIVPITILLALMFVAYFTREYAKQLLYWIETQNGWIVFALFTLLFIIVSFPVVVGYFVLMITSGYLFGFLKGLLAVIIGANVGIAIAHLTIRSIKHRIPIQRVIKNDTGRAILRVISGTKAFRVVLFTRLTPIPFGIQNAIFGVSSINQRVYHTASFLGLLPAQIINIYLGSTLRSMHEVLNSHGTAFTGYVSFGIEVICGSALMFWVVQKARKELTNTLLTDISNDNKLIDIEV